MFRPVESANRDSSAKELSLPHPQILNRPLADIASCLHKTDPSGMAVRININDVTPASLAASSVVASR